MAEQRYICIHGHFYQPPRENPWLEAIEVQDSAAPDHDWNERITRECYAPNTRSRLLDGQGQIVHMLNNYAWMSFNFGPTLLSWLEDHAPDVLHGIVEADRVSRERYGGHGNALAQVYNHVIMPLATERDKRTQIRWGIADFERRFGRQPEGMWLAEAAADTASLEALAEAGIRFTVLAPGQAKHWRQLGSEEWDGQHGIDPSRAYTCRLPSGRSIALFFYDGNISRQVAFERLLDRGERFLERLLHGFDENRPHAQLMHIATDGESYGHHHAFGDMALAYVLDQLQRQADVKLTNYGEFLERYPPEWEVEIHENSSWSCAHGVERWRSNCGCKMRGDWQQEWRGPLRKALDQLKARLDNLFATLGRQFFTEPWEARDAYIDIIVDRDDASVRRFFQKYGYADLDERMVGDGLALLEMQRNGMLMFTSCGWFFDEISGLETTQCLRYAARALQLAHVLGRDFEDEFVQELENAPSNLPVFGTGRGVWEQLIRPWQVDLNRVLAHYAISLIYHPNPEERVRVFCYDLEVLDQDVLSRGSSHISIGRLRVRSRLTWNRAETSFAVVHYGGLDFYTVLRQGPAGPEYADFKQRFLETFRKGSLADVTALLTREFDGEVHRLDDLFKEEQRRVIRIVLHDRFEDYQRSFERLANQDEDLLNRLGRLGYPIPKPFANVASNYLDTHLEEEITALETGGSVARIQALDERGKAWGYQPERERLSRYMTEALQRQLLATGPESELPQHIDCAQKLLDAAELLGIPLTVWRAQNLFLNAYARLEAQTADSPELRASLAALAQKLRVSGSLLGWRP